MGGNKKISVVIDGRIRTCYLFFTYIIHPCLPLVVILGSQGPGRMRSA